MPPAFLDRVSRCVSAFFFGIIQLDVERGPLLTVKQVAELLVCSPANVYALIEGGELPSINIGAKKGLRIDPADLETFVDGRKTHWAEPRTKPPRPRLKHIRLN